MKKLLSLSITCIIASLLFSSCKSNSSLIKRHYNNGYYASHSSGKQSALPKEDKAVQPKAKKTLYAAQNITDKKTISGYLNPLPNNTVIVASAKKTQSKSSSEKKTKKSITQKNKIILYPITQIKNTVSQLKKVDNDSSDKDGLSLFWIVILLILILWAVGFLYFTSIGYLIHILLVIALVLFILWLLRII